MNDAQMEQLCGALKHNPNIEKITLICGGTDKSATYIADMIKSIPSLTHVGCNHFYMTIIHSLNNTLDGGLGIGNEAAKVIAESLQVEKSQILK
jgi:hypothetical protein